MSEKTTIRIAIVEDNNLVRKAYRLMIESFSSVSDRFDYAVVLEAESGKELIEKIREHDLDVVLMNTAMIGMEGFEIMRRVKAIKAKIKVLVLTMSDIDAEIIHMLKSGATGCLSKNSEPEELMLAINSLFTKGYYYSDHITRKMAELLAQESRPVQHLLVLNERELEFLKLIATEYTYKEIADRMYLSPRTVDGYRDALFEKLNVRTRVGLAMYAVRNGIVSVEGFDPNNNKSLNLKSEYVNR